jgi:TonB-linked SusC/RagA family outer membrane protein
MEKTRFLRLLLLLVFCTLFTSVYSQQKAVTGKVSDPSGAPIPGVTIIVKGTTKGVITDFDGNYSFSNVPSDATLVFSFVGMKTQEVLVSGKTVINVVLEEETIGLEEVVAVGYGTQKKSNITGAISSIKADDLANRSTTNATSALQGKVSGVQIVNTSGAPGATSTLRIRGYSSNGSSNPLYIVDGLKVPDIDYLDASNIESMEILKDAASAAIYGAEAGNGVVLITTKSGKKAEGKIFLESQVSVSSLAHKMDLLNANEFINYITEADASRAQLLKMYYYNDPSSYLKNKLVDTDWQDAMYSTGIRQRYSVGFQGGNENGSLFVSLGYLDHNGIIIGKSDTYKRITGQFNGSYKIKNWLEVGINNSIETAKMYQIGENAVLYGATMSVINLMDPLTPVEYEDGLTGTSQPVKDAVKDGLKPVINKETGNYYGVSWYNHSNNNPLAQLALKDEYTESFNINGTAFANITPFKNFVFTSRLGYRLGNNYHYRFDAPSWMSPGSTASLPYMAVTQLGSKYYQWENFVNYSFDLDKSTFSVLGGMSYSKSIANFMSSTTDNLESSANNFRYLDYSTTTANDNIAGNTTEKIQMAYFGRLGWSYDNRYSLQVNFRADSYDAAYLDLNHNWGYFPAISAGWAITNEKFMAGMNRDIFSSAKLRVSYGKNGSISNLGGYMYAATLNSGATFNPDGYIIANNKYWINNDLYSGIYPSQYLANPKLRWEESKQLGLGLDLRFFKDRMTLTADYYNKNTDGLLVQSVAPLTTGTSFVFQNLGIVNNHGLELDLEWKDVIKKDFQYSIKANIGTVSNKVKEYKGEGTRISGASLAHAGTAITYFEEGYPLWYLRGYKIESIDPTDGKPIYKDIDGKEGITDADRTYLGSGIPQFTYGTTIKFAYKNFDLLLFGTGAYGAKLFYGGTRATTEIQNRPKFLYNDRWTPLHTNATVAAPRYQADPMYLNSDAFVFDASYFKIKQIQLGYNVPKSISKKLKIEALRAFVSLDDYFTFTSYPGNDPEVRPDASSAMSIDMGGYPIAKSVMFGLNATF